jgi:hypothetical protein
MQLKHKMAAAVVAALAMSAPFGLHAAPRTHTAPGHAAHKGLEASPGSGYCDPESGDWVVDSDGDGIPDVDEQGLLPGTLPPSSGHPAAAAAVAQVIGTTPEAIERNFIGVVTRNLANAGTASRVARLSDRELSAIAAHAGQGAAAERAALLKLFASRLDGAPLVRVARAFGRAPVEAAVRAYATPAVQAAFASAVAGLAAPPPEGGGGGGGGSYPSPSPPRPTVDMTLEEIYLEFRTAPVGSLSPAGALAETAQFAGMRLSAAGWVGTAIGTGISWLIQNYAPNLDDAIGGTIAIMIDNFWAATSELQQGEFESAFDSLFGSPVTWSSDPWGDWDISDPMVSYYQWSGSCE